MQYRINDLESENKIKWTLDVLNKLKLAFKC